MPSCTCRWCCRRSPSATCCCCCSACAVRSAAGCSAHLGIELAFTTAGAALATAVMTLSAHGARDPPVAGERRSGPGRGRAHARRARPSIASSSITLPLMLPGILAGAVTAFAAGLGEFGAVITFASNVPGVTRTLPLALYTAMQSPSGRCARAAPRCPVLHARVAGTAGGRASRAARAHACSAASLLSAPGMLRVSVVWRRPGFTLEATLRGTDAGCHRALRTLRAAARPRWST